ncbi:MAG: type II toxin-antitoxin system RelE/ParE family toxin [Deltaproteobacteria bacterium]|nr:type II toxin-antitoxin system RelE/ParE family toxin [Deltaproteobacteria bacterium]
MRRAYVLTPLARADLREIVRFIAKRNPDAARRVRGELEQAMVRLAEHPDMGHVRDDLAPATYRFWPVYSYLIIYRPNTTPMQVIRVWHGAQLTPDLPNI